ncbi:hypothetical protein HMPREF0682_2005 [Propionibacterium acidifaciens F0233]|uniref:Uncharacterized protein n=1 Tax=Propionibacterium acidifaciens F0233 TaxID=553198 RepID=U2RP66_9ACTN|nr:hypothetical protein HMPREF0682_2005 [Propionibacterium acidifaciens F0233]
MTKMCFVCLAFPTGLQHRGRAAPHASGRGVRARISRIRPRAAGPAGP